MNKLCFLSNLTSDEWAAWVQATGTLLAIGAAIWIASQQHRNDVAKAKAERAERTQRIARISTMFGDQLVECINELVIGSPAHDVPRIWNALYRLREIVEISRSVDLIDLPQKAASPFMALRVCAGQACWYADAVTGSPPTIGFGTVQGEFARIQRSAVEANGMLAALFADAVSKDLAESDGGRSSAA